MTSTLGLSAATSRTNANRLASSAGPARMPRDVNPTQAEQRDLENYFMHLAAQQGAVTK